MGEKDHPHHKIKNSSPSYVPGPNGRNPNPNAGTKSKDNV